MIYNHDDGGRRRIKGTTTSQEGVPVHGGPSETIGERGERVDITEQDFGSRSSPLWLSTPSTRTSRTEATPNDWEGQVIFTRKYRGSFRKCLVGNLLMFWSWLAVD
jgi:hypothetical protein